MSHKTTLIWLCIFSKFVLGRRQFIILLDDVACFGYGGPVLQAECQLETYKNQSVVNAFIVLSQEVTAFQIKATTELPRQGTIVKLFDFTTDGCQTLNTMDSMNILKSVLAFARRSGHIPKKCPLKANENFTVTRFSLDADLLPTYTPEFSFVTNLRGFVGANMVVKVLAKGRVEMKRKHIH